MATDDLALLYDYNGKLISSFPLKGEPLMGIGTSPRFVQFQTASGLYIFNTKGQLLSTSTDLTFAHLGQPNDMLYLIGGSSSSLAKLMEPGLLFTQAPAGPVKVTATNGEESCEAAVKVVAPEGDKPVWLLEDSQNLTLGEESFLPLEEYVSGPLVNLSVAGPNISSIPVRASVFNVSGNVVAAPVSIRHYAGRNGLFYRVSYNTSVLQVDQCYESLGKCDSSQQVPLAKEIDALGVDAQGMLLAYTYKQEGWNIRFYSFKNKANTNLTLTHKARVSDLVWAGKGQRYLAAVVPSLVTVQVLSVALDGQDILPLELYEMDSSFPFSTQVSLFSPLSGKFSAWDGLLYIRLLEGVLSVELGPRSALDVQLYKTAAPEFQYFLSPQSLALHTNANIEVRNLFTGGSQKQITVPANISVVHSGLDNLFLIAQGQYWNVRFDLPLHACLSHSVPLKDQPDLVDAFLGSNNLLSLYHKGLAYMQDYRQQGVTLDIQTELKGFLNHLSVDLLAANSAGSSKQTHSLLLFNYETKLTTNFHPEPTKAQRSNVTLSMNDTNWFNGSRLRYELSCADCGRTVTLRQHLEPYARLALKPQAFFKQSSDFAWVVTNDAVFEMDGTGAFTRTILQLPADQYNCSAVVVSKPDNIGLMACVNVLKESKLLVVSLASPNPVLVDELNLKDLSVAKLQIVGGYLFVHYRNDKGGVNVHTLGSWDLAASVLPDEWDASSSLADIEVVANGTQIVLAATLSRVGLAVITMAHDDQGRLQKLGKDVARLIDPVPQLLAEYVTSSNRFMQGRLTDRHASAQQLNLTLIMLSSESAHVKVLFKLAMDGTTGASFQGMLLVQAYNRYGSHATLPMIERVCSPNCGCSGNGFVVGYLKNGMVAYVTYEYGGKMLMETKGGLQHAVSQQVAFMPFSDLFLFRGEDGGLTVANYSNNVSLVILNVSDDVTSIKLNVSAVSDYGLAMFETEVQFDSTSHWVFYLMIVMLILLVLVAVGGTVYWRIRKSREENMDTLVETDSGLR